MIALAVGCVADVQPMSHGLTHLDLFSGIGGFALAAHWAGFRTIGFSEVEPYACRVLAERFPDVPNIGDVRQRANFSRFSGGVSVLTGGFPCQPWSLAGKQGGTSDHRHLWPAMCDVIAEVRPAWIIGENVFGIISVGLEPVCAELECLGYSTQPFIIPACAVDAVAHANSCGRRAFRASETQSGSAGGLINGREQPAPLADADGLRQLQPQGRECAERGRAGDGCQNVADTNSAGQEERDAPAVSETAGHGSGCDDQSWRSWTTESGICRVAHGIPDRAHRLNGLGNAIVPQVAERFFRFIARLES